MPRRKAKAKAQERSKEGSCLQSSHLKALLLGVLVVLVVTHNTVGFQKAFLYAEMDKATAGASGGSYDMAYDESYGFFDDITNEAWLRRKRWARDFNKDLRYDQAFLKQYKAHFLRNVEPYFACPEKVRLGGIGDGPKWICDIHRLKGISERRKEQARAKPNNKDADKHGCLVYSIGSAGNFDFENSVRATVGEGECEIHTFDPTGDFSSKMDNPDGKSYYHMWGLKSAGAAMNGPNYFDLSEIVRRLGHEGRAIDLFKIDCEGCEWFSFEAIAAQGNIRQVMVEVHWREYTNPEKGFKLFDAFAKNGLIMFSKELNDAWPTACAEFSFIRFKQSFLGLPSASG